MSKILGPECGYIEMLNHFTVEAAKKQKLTGNKSNPLRPSSAGKCTRELAFEYAVYKGLIEAEVPTEPAEVQRIFGMGHKTEDLMKWEFRKAFKEAGDVFDPELAAKLRTHVYEKGSTEEAMELYKKFRGRQPKIDALLKVRGLDGSSD